jgi:hypothetical protein
VARSVIGVRERSAAAGCVGGGFQSERVAGRAQRGAGEASASAAAVRWRCRSLTRSLGGGLRRSRRALQTSVKRATSRRSHARSATQAPPRRRRVRQ